MTKASAQQRLDTFGVAHELLISKDYFLTQPHADVFALEP